jgi:ribonuclease Z
VTFLGTSSAAPTRDRGLPAVAIQREGEVVLMDCGEGVQRQIIGQGVGLNKEMAILITHLHGDHVTGLLGLLQTMGLAQRTKPLTIVGPPDLLKWLKLTSRLLHIGLTFPIQFYPARTGKVLRLRSFRIRTARALHSIEAYSYVVEENPRPGEFHPEKARELGIPEGKLWSKLQKGRSVTVGGRTYSSSDVTGPRRPGRKIGYSGDTRPSSRLVRFFRRCDLLIFDSTFQESDKAKAIERKHSTSTEAAEVASKARARRLALTHFSARYARSSALVREARTVFPNTFAAVDGMTVSVDYPPS